MVGTAAEDFKEPDRKESLLVWPLEAMAGRVCFSPVRSFRGTNSSASPSALQRRALSEFGVLPLNRQR
jgi:hypothetical protein